jgi:hypothetical protein
MVGVTKCGFKLRCEHRFIWRFVRGDHVFQTCQVIRSCMQETQVVPHLFEVDGKNVGGVQHWNEFLFWATKRTALCQNGVTYQLSLAALEDQGLLRRFHSFHCFPGATNCVQLLPRPFCCDGQERSCAHPVPVAGRIQQDIGRRLSIVPY